MSNQTLCECNLLEPDDAKVSSPVLRGLGDSNVPRLPGTMRLFWRGSLSPLLLHDYQYLSRVEQNEREIAYWEARTSDSEKAALELTMCMDALDKLARLWDIGEPEDRQGMARSLFSYIIYNLDTRRIVDFRLKPWADRFLVLRAALYEDESGSDPASTPTVSGSEPQAEDVLPEGFEPPTPGSEDLRSIP